MRSLPDPGSTKFQESSPNNPVSTMVVPSEKNTDIFDLTMEEQDQDVSKNSALTNINTLSDEKDPPTPDKVVERDKCDEGSKDDDEASSEACEQSLDHIPIAADAEPNLAINHSSPTTDINHSNSVLSLVSRGDENEIKVLGESSDIETSVLGDDNHINESIPVNEGLTSKTFASTLFETLGTTADCLDETTDLSDQIDVEEEVADDDDEDEQFKSSTNLSLGLGEAGARVEELAATPPRLAAPPLLTSTPHSLPPSSLLSPVSSLLADLGPVSLPGSGSKSYDYLLKVLLVGDSDVGKQEILSGLEDGSVDSPYCSSTGAGMTENLKSDDLLNLILKGVKHQHKTDLPIQLTRRPRS